MKKFFKEFKAFITRGNVIDMAVGVIVGGAFTAIVTALTANVFQPIVNWVLAKVVGGDGLAGALTFLEKVYEVDADGKLTNVVDLAQSIYIDWGAVVSAVLNFLIIALILFAIVKAINRLHDAAKPRYYGYEKSEYRKMRLSGMSEEQIEAKAAERDKAAAEAQAAADAEAKKHTTEALLEDIKALLAEQVKK